jgi:hypothetical protein
MLIALALAVVVTGQTRTPDLPKLVYDIPIVAGQREIILGAKPMESIFLNGFYEREIPAKPLITPDNTGGYVDSMIPGGTAEDSLGYFDCTTKAGTLFEKPCIVITSNARWNQKMGKKPKVINWQNSAKQQWWISPEGVIMRHYSWLQTPDGNQSGDCTYGKDSIQRRYTNTKNETTFGEIFPSCGFDALNAQFKPMIVDGKVVLREKDFCVVNPLTGGIEKYNVHTSGTFKGTLLFATFQGKIFSIDGPNRISQKVFIDDSGDIVKVALSDEKYFLIQSVPASHTDKYGRPIRKGGG